MDRDAGFVAALAEAKQGASEGGIPIGAALVSEAGVILGQGHNTRVQNGSPVFHVSILHELRDDLLRFEMRPYISTF